MIVFPNRPDPGENLTGYICVPEVSDFDFHEGPDEDEFVRLLTESLSKSLAVEEDEIPDPPKDYTEDDMEEAAEKRMSDEGDGWIIE